MKTRFLYAAAFTALLAASQANAGPVFDLDNSIDLLEVHPVEMQIIRDKDGKVTSREIFSQADGSQVTRTTVREPAAVQQPRSSTVELTPAQRRLIWNTVAVPGTTARSGEEIPAEQAELPKPLVREHIEAVPALKPVNVGTKVTVPSGLQPLPATVTEAVPSVQNYLYAVVEDRVLVIEPVTKTIAAEVGRSSEVSR